MTAAAVTAPAASRGRFGLAGNAVLVVAAVAAGYVAVNAVSGLYHLLDIIPAVHGWWHRAVPDKATRNDIRDVWEYLTGGYAAQLLTWNSLKWHAKGGGGWLDKLDARIPGLNRFRQWVRRFPLPELGVSYVLSLPAAAAGFTAVYFATRAIPQWAWHVPVPGHPRAFLLSSVIVNHKAMGLAASYFFGRHMMRLAYDDVQFRLAEQSAARDRNPLSWLWLPNYRARVAAVRSSRAGQPMFAYQVSGACRPAAAAALRAPASGHRRLQAALISLAGLVFVLLAVYGWLVLSYVARGQPMPWGLR
jgi:hypothetical protein